MGSSYIVQRMQQGISNKANLKQPSSGKNRMGTQIGSVFKLRSVHAPSNMKFLFFSFCRLPLGTSREVLEPVCTSFQQAIVKYLQNSLTVNLRHYYKLDNINLEPGESYLKYLKVYHFVIILLNVMAICDLEVCCTSYRVGVKQHVMVDLLLMSFQLQVQLRHWGA